MAEGEYEGAALEVTLLFHDNGPVSVDPVHHFEFIEQVSI